MLLEGPTLMASEGALGGLHDAEHQNFHHEHVLLEKPGGHGPFEELDVLLLLLPMLFQMT